MNKKGKWWTHTCKDVGETQIPHGEVCNWCDVTEEDIQDKVVKEPQDFLEDVRDY